jgi:nucleoside-diphosphate-sugar epimerase
MANVLIIGGTGNISMGIIKALRGRYGAGAKITVFNRGQSDDVLPAEVTRLHGDRNDFAAFEKQFADSAYDAVIDMICFRPEQAESAIRAFAGRTPHFIFCSTVCTYGNTQTIVPTPESATPRPHSAYAKNKLACEGIFLEASRKGAFGTSAGTGGVTVFRPSHTFGPGFPFHGNLGGGGSPGFIDRLRKGLPVIVSGDGHGLWQIAASDDVGKGFAWAIGRPHTYHEVYNIASDRVITWDELTEDVAMALGAPRPRIVHIPTDVLLAIDPVRYGTLRDIFQYHGVYSNAKIHRDIPEYRETTDFGENLRASVQWLEKRGKLRTAESDRFESELIELYEGFAQSARERLGGKTAVEST